MGFDGDFDPAVIEFPSISYTPGYETGTTWATLYSSEVSGALALSQGSYYVSNFLTRDIAGKTEGICVNQWDFNFVKARTVEGNVVARPQGYNRKEFQKCDCSYHRCDRQFQGITFSLNIKQLWFGDSDGNGLKDVLAGIDGVSGSVGANDENPFFDKLGFPQIRKPPTGFYTELYGGNGGGPYTGTIDTEKIEEYDETLKKMDYVQQGSKETKLLTYALIDFCQSITGGVFFKNNIISMLAFAQSTLNLTTQDYGEIEDGGAAWGAAASDIVYNYQRNAKIPGFEASILYKNFTGVTGNENLHEKCMCLDGGMHGYDAYPFADINIVNDQLKMESGAGGIDALNLIGFQGTETDKKELAEFLAIDGQYLKTLGIANARDYKYGPNWAYGEGFGELNVVSVSTPEYKNWEVRNSGKIRMSGTPNGEPYSFGRPWLEWGQRIGIPTAEYVPVNPITLGGGDFADAGFGYKGNINGSIIYRGRLKANVLAYEAQEYEFAFRGITIFERNANAGDIILGLTTVRHIDAVTNYEAYGITGSIEEIVFSEGFSEVPQDKTVYRL